MGKSVLLPKSADSVLPIEPKASPLQLSLPSLTRAFAALLSASASESRGSAARCRRSGDLSHQECRIHVVPLHVWFACRFQPEAAVVPRHLFPLVASSRFHDGFPVGRQLFCQCRLGLHSFPFVEGETSTPPRHIGHFFEPFLLRLPSHSPSLCPPSNVVKSANSTNCPL